VVGNHATGSLESSYTRALRGLGCDVRVWSPISAYVSASWGRRLARVSAAYLTLEPWLRKANLDLLRTANETRPDLLLVVATWGIRAGTLAQIRTRVPACLQYCLFPDSPHMLDNARINCLPIFDRVLTSSPSWMDAFRRLGARRVEYLPFAADPALHPRVPASSGVGPDVAFIGNWRPDREALLEQLSDFDLHIWGSKYWVSRTSRDSPVRSHWRGGQVIGEDFARVCAAAKILLNVMDAVSWPGPNMRTFELPACGAFALAERSDAVLEIFTEGETIACFEGAEEARQKIAYYLANPEERNRIAQAAYDLVTNGGHRYVDRARQLLEWLEVDCNDTEPRSGLG